MIINRSLKLASTLTSLVLILVPSTALAAHHTYNYAGNGKTTPSAYTGNDVSWPQCSNLRSLPSGQAFGIVGVNGGVANTSNACFAQELSWAEKSSGLTLQPKASLYVNTANPGDVQPAVSDWPTNNINVVSGSTDTDPYGVCGGADDLACSWQYGYNMANLDVNERGVTNPSAYTWYLDVETANSWTASVAENAADLEGMADYFSGAGGQVGIYSTATQWTEIVGSGYGTSSDAGGNVLNGLASWLPGASSLSAAEANCHLPSLTPNGKVTLTQYVSRRTDYDYSCS